MHPLVKNLTGQQFGRLTALEHVGTFRGRRASWLCQCKCGNTVTAVSADLLAGKTRSCGCLQQESARDLLAKHGQVGLPEFNIWRGILKRCNSSRHPGYLTHGACGIRCCWQSFDEMVADVGERPSPEHRLVRLDPAGNFEDGNCSWLTRSEQGRIHSNYKKYRP